MVTLDRADKVFLKISFLGLIFRYILAVIIPIANDEAYYLDWSYDLQLSYFDHPPGVSVVSFLSRQIFDGPLAARGLSPIIFLVASWFLWLSYKKITKKISNISAFWFSMYLLLVPALSLWGITLMPDLGLFLSISMVLWFVLTYRLQDRLAATQGVLLGLLLGIGGVFKYHILLVGGGLALAMFIERVYIRKTSWDLYFWLSVVVSGAVATLPVWVWNYQNNFDGILFQTHHGFEDGSFNILFILRTFMALFLVLGPSFFIYFFKLWNKNAWSENRKAYFIYFLLGSVLISVVLIYSSFFKQSLPHWFYPACWIAFPFAFEKLLASSRLSFAANLILCGAITVGATTGVALYNSMPIKTDDSFLSELTMWDEIYENIDFESAQSFLDGYSESLPNCQGRSYGSFRWYWAAQLNYRDREKRWTSLDPDNRSYYDYIRKGDRSSGCPLVLVGDSKHLNPKKLQDKYRVINTVKVTLERHSFIDLTMFLVEVK